jgi:hypothetical protein
MIEILFEELKQFLLVYRLLFATTRKYSPPDVQLESDTRGVRIWACGGDCLLEMWAGHRDDARSVDRFAVPHSMLLTIQTGVDEPVRFSRIGEYLVIDWEERGVPQQNASPVKEYDQSEWPEKLSTTARSTNVLATDHRFLEAMREAAATTDDISTRYALDTIELDGELGTITATDGRHALIQRGFKFPWEGSILIPASKLFKSNPWLRTVQRNRWPIHVWKDEDWFLMQIDQMKIGFRAIDRRFPKTEFLKTNDESAKSILKLDESDAKFFLERVKCLPGRDQDFSPITVDLNGAVMIRAQGVEQDAAVELVLSNSQREGDECVVSTNRNYLARAISMGFRRISIIDSETPAFCNDANRTYVWGLLHGGDVVPRSENVSTVSSPAKLAPVIPRPTRKHRSSKTSSSKRSSSKTS